MTLTKSNISALTTLSLIGALLTSIASPALANGVPSPAFEVDIPACTTEVSAGVLALTNIVCFDASSSSLRRGQDDIPFTLNYTDNALNGGPSFSLNVQQVECTGDNPPTNCLTPAGSSRGIPLSPVEGDVGKFIIKYPNKGGSLANGGSLTVSRGLELATSAYATTKAKSFEYLKTVEVNVVVFDIDIEFVKVWNRLNCGFSQIVNEDTTYKYNGPSEACDLPNTGDAATDSFGYHWNQIGFFTGGTFFSGQDVDGLFFNTRSDTGTINNLPAVTLTINRLTAVSGTGVTVLEILIADYDQTKRTFTNDDGSVGSYYAFAPSVGDKLFLTGVSGLGATNAVTITDIESIESNGSLTSGRITFNLEGNRDVLRAALNGAMVILPGSIDIQEVGPKFTAGTELNSGALEIFIPEGYMKYIFGQTSTVLLADVLAQRVDVLSATEILAESLTFADNGLAVKERLGGIVITVDSHGYSAPGFSFHSIDKTPLVSTASPSVSSGGGFVPQQPVVLEGPKIKFTLERVQSSRVKLAKLRALADFKMKPRQKVRIRIAKSSRLDCQRDSGRIVSLTGEACLIRATKLFANGSKSKQTRLIRLVYR